MKRMLTLVVAVLGLVAMPAMGEPEIFSKSGFKADQAAAVAGRKLQVAYFTASWCPPCKKMKAETWVDEKIESWADANAIVTMVDIDEQGPLASEYRVRSIPTIVVLMGDQEIGRTVGYQAPDEFLTWLDGYRVSHLDPARAKAGAPVKAAPGAEANADAPAVSAGLSADEALKMYVAELKGDTTGFGVTGSVLVPRLAELAQTDEELMKELAYRAEVLLEGLKGDGAAGLTDVREFLQIAPIAGMGEQAAAWVMEQLQTPAGEDVVRRHAMLAASALTRAGKFAEANGLVGDPVMHARKLMSAASKASSKAMRGLDESMVSAFESGQAELVRRELADAVAMALVAGERAKAKAIARLMPGDRDAAQGAVDAAAERAGVEGLMVGE